MKGSVKVMGLLPNSRCLLEVIATNHVVTLRVIIRVIIGGRKYTIRFLLDTLKGTIRFQQDTIKGKCGNVGRCRLMSKGFFKFSIHLNVVSSYRYNSIDFSMMQPSNSI